MATNTSHIHELQQLVNRLNALIAIKNQETDQLETSSDISYLMCKLILNFWIEQIKEIEQLISSHIKNHTELYDKGIPYPI